MKLLLEVFGSEQIVEDQSGVESESDKSNVLLRYITESDIEYRKNLQA